MTIRNDVLKIAELLGQDANAVIRELLAQERARCLVDFATQIDGLKAEKARLEGEVDGLNDVIVNQRHEIGMLIAAALVAKETSPDQMTSSEGAISKTLAAIQAIADDVGVTFIGAGAHSGWVFEVDGARFTLGPTSHEVFKQRLSEALNEHLKTSKTTVLSATSAAPSPAVERGGDVVAADGAGVPPPASSGPFVATLAEGATVEVVAPGHVRVGALHLHGATFVCTRRDSKGRRWWDGDTWGFLVDALNAEAMWRTFAEADAVKPRMSRIVDLADVPALLAADAVKGAA